LSIQVHARYVLQGKRLVPALYTNKKDCIVGQYCLLEVPEKLVNVMELKLQSSSLEIVP